MALSLQRFALLLVLGLAPMAAFSNAGGYKLGSPFPTDADVCQMVTGQGLSGGSFIACPQHERGAISDRKREGAIEHSKAGRWVILRLAAIPKASDLAETYQGFTLVTFDRSHGTQVEYFSAKNVFLWYPGNTAIVHGNWKVSAKPAGQSEICFRYQTNSYNPATGVRGGNWECSPVRYNQVDIRHRLEGDPFDLRSGEVPFIFERRKRVTLRALARGAAIKFSDLKDIGKP